MSKDITIYDYMRDWFDFCFENNELITPNHSALYFFILSHSNRMGWKPKFGLPTTMAKEAIGMRSYSTYIKALNDLVGFGFIKMIEKSKNQYSSNIIALSKNNKALIKALDKATIKHATKQSESTVQSIDSIIIPSTNIPINKNIYRQFAHLSLSVEDFEKLNTKWGKVLIDEILDSIENYKGNKNYTSLYLTANKWLQKEYPVKIENTTPSSGTNQRQPNYADDDY